MKQENVMTELNYVFVATLENDNEKDEDVLFRRENI